ncbi:(2Fe-2S)-binding protein [Roseibium denhamense]|uniref:BFD-like [2Fe-2S] binding domain-containing protein n=1 Tax=Roseibium denhamense TaxID=76305 RepID=A0ABY1P043_9HYPH|nr:(2Fe-2S)-binding protein [Roseibium denhamense]MTI05124.1 (2Fe-2S)-binding protein [Roseibium denhamense]SMP22750.1 BFD-like [2Fe-2S] binding domain-containing protein [Roseibium denhamense]
MLICSCNVLSDKQLREAAEEMRADPNGKVPTPGAVFRHLGCRPRCGGCFPSVIDIIHEKGSEEAKEEEQPLAAEQKTATG